MQREILFKTCIIDTIKEELSTIMIDIISVTLGVSILALIIVVYKRQFIDASKSIEQWSYRDCISRLPGEMGYYTTCHETMRVGKTDPYYWRDHPVYLRLGYNMTPVCYESILDSYTREITCSICNRMTRDLARCVITFDADVCYQCYYDDRVSFIIQYMMLIKEFVLDGGDNINYYLRCLLSSIFTLNEGFASFPSNTPTEIPLFMLKYYYPICFHFPYLPQPSFSIEIEGVQVRWDFHEIDYHITLLHYTMFNTYHIYSNRKLGKSFYRRSDEDKLKQFDSPNDAILFVADYIKKRLK